MAECGLSQKFGIHCRQTLGRVSIGDRRQATHYIVCDWIWIPNRRVWIVCVRRIWNDDRIIRIGVIFRAYRAGRAIDYLSDRSSVEMNVRLQAVSLEVGRRIVTRLLTTFRNPANRRLAFFLIRKASLKSCTKKPSPSGELKFHLKQIAFQHLS